MPDTLDWPALVALNLSACIRLSALPAALGKCMQLKEINISNCTALTELPDLSAIHALQLTGLPPALAAWQDGGLKALTIVAPPSAAVPERRCMHARGSKSVHEVTRPLP